MSRIGSKEIKIPNGVEVHIDNIKNIVKISGQYGTICVNFPKSIVCNVDNNTFFVKRSSETYDKKEKKAREMHGTIRAIINNAMIGVSSLFKKELELIGSGYRVEKNGKNLTLFVGFSHPIIVQPPEGVKMECQNNKIIITGIEKQLVGDEAAKIRKIRVPNLYTGNGIRYVDEKIIFRKRKGTDTSSSGSSTSGKNVKKAKK